MKEITIITPKGARKEIISDEEYISIYGEQKDTRTYEQKVEDFIAEKYTVKQEIALINNYNLDNKKYKQEYEEYQEYRRQCKERAKSIPTQESEE